MTFSEALRQQRWDDHRYYHQSRINQTLHFISACSFVVAYAWLLVDPAVAALIAWLVSMTTRQSGHFFFEPTGYDTVNQATQAHKEAIKVGYNLQRKIVLLSLWVGLPALIWWAPDLFGWATSLEPGWGPYAHRVGLAWLVLGVGAVLLRTLHLFVIRDVQTGLVWMTKIVTDPFHDIKIYCRAPLHLMRGQMLDPDPQRM